MIRHLTVIALLMSTVINEEVSNSVYRCPRGCNCLSEGEGCVGYEEKFGIKMEQQIVIGEIYNEDSFIICNKANLTEIPVRELSPTVEKLSLSKNNITSIRKEAFVKLKNLVELNLDSNGIVRIERFAFKGLGRLRALSVQKTSLCRLEKFSFSGLQNMTFILLAENRITAIEESAFAGSSNIRLLLLHNNPIHVIESRAFAHLRNVEFLILPSGLKEIEPDAFNGLDSVGLLKLPFMDLKCVNAFTFRGLSHVLVLDIRESDLGVVRPHIFDGLVNVTSLKLIRNKIDYLEALRVGVDNKIKNFTLEGNHVLQIPAPGSVDVRVLDNFTVVNNHFPCDCRLHSLVAGPLANGTSYNFSARNFCISPLSVNGKSISDVNLENVSRCADEYSSSVDSWNVAASSLRRKLTSLCYSYVLSLTLTLIATSSRFI